MLDNINEIGEGVTPYKFSIGEETKYGMDYNFKTEDGDDYLVQFDQGFYEDEYDLAFFSVGSKGFMSDEETNKGRQFKIVSTVIEIVKDFLKETPGTTSIIFSGKNKEGGGINQRNLLYNKYVEKQIHNFPGWDYKIENGDTKIFKKESIRESIQLNGFAKYLVESFLQETNEKYNERIAIFPGGMKPPTVAHFHIVDEISKHPEITKLKVLIGPKERDGITDEQSLKIWNIYKKYLNNKVEFSKTTSLSPVKDVLDIVKNNPSNFYFLVFGREEDSNRFQSAKKYDNIKIINIKDVGDGISGTKARQQILDNNFEGLQRYLPVNLTFKERKEIWGLLTNNKIKLNEGSYDSIVNQVSSDVFNYWKQEFIKDPTQEQITFEKDYELEDSKGHLLEFSCIGYFKLEKDGDYIVDGGTDEGTEDKEAYLELKFQIDPTELPKTWSTISMDLKDVVRHEIEHITQSGYNVINSKEMKDDRVIRQMINSKKLPTSTYFKLEKEIDAMLQGMYLKAKKSHTPFKDVINDYFDKLEINDDDKNNILNVWEKRLKSLSLPPIKEDLIPGGLAQNKSLEDIAKHHDKKGYYDIKDMISSLEIQLKKGIEIEMEHTNDKNIAKEISMDHLWEDPNYYDKLETIEESKPIIEYKNQEILNPLLWENNKIKPKLREALLKVANTFYENLKTDIPLEDIILLGSSANYNWTEYSDIDLHLVLNYGEKENAELYKNLFDSKKIEFNNKYKLEYKNHSVEVYVQDVNEPNAAQGIYSLLKDEWLKEPTKEQIEVSDEEINRKVEPLMGKIDSYGKDTNVEEIHKLKDRIAKLRKTGLENEGEYSVENLAFKRLRNEGYLEKLSDLLKEKTIQNFGLNQINELEDNEIKYWANYFNVFNKLKDNPDKIYKILKTKLKGEQLNALAYFYDFLKQDNKQKLNEGQIQIEDPKIQEYIDKALEYCCNDLKITKPELILMDEEYSKDNSSFGGYSPVDKKVYLQIKNRNLKDLIVTLFHELNHHKQNLNNELKPESGQDGDDIENESNAYAGKLMRKFGRENPEIFTIFC